MAAPPQTGMEKAEMKQLLNKAAPDNPINFAFAQGKEPAFALLKMDKMKNPKACDKIIAEEFKDSKNSRWGTLIIDPAVNSSLVRFTVNKAVSGMAKRLTKTLKGTGYNQVEIVLEDGTLVDGAKDEEEEGEAQADGASTAPPAPPPPPPPPPAPAPPAAAPTLSLGELQKELMALVPRIAPTAGDNAALKAEWMKLAGDANGNLKANDLTLAATTIKLLGDKLRGGAAGQSSTAKAAASSAPPPGTAAGAVVYAKSRLAWIAARQRMTSDIEKLRSELANTYKDAGLAAEVEKSYHSVVAPLLESLDESLADKLDDATNATDPTQRAKLVAEAREIMVRYEEALKNPVIADLDGNPFVPLTIQKTLSATLTGLSAAIR